MMRLFSTLFRLSEGEHDRIVPPSGITARLTTLTASAMAFLAVFALAISLATAQLAQRWGSELAQSATIRLSAPQDQMAAQLARVMEILDTTPGVREARVLEADEQRALLEPWLGPDLPLEQLALPELIDVVEDRKGYDREGLRLRLAAEAPGAVLDDHTRWRAPLVSAANGLRAVALFALLLTIGVTSSMILMATHASLAANEQIIRTLRHVGATDDFIASAFIRRFTVRAFLGAAIGTFLAALVVLILPDAKTESGLLTGVGLNGVEWLILPLLPLAASGVAYLSTRGAARRVLSRMM